MKLHHKICSRSQCRIDESEYVFGLAGGPGFGGKYTLKIRARIGGRPPNCIFMRIISSALVFALCWALALAFSQPPLLKSFKSAHLLPNTKRRAAGQWNSPVAKLEAILLDCDGILADTERDGHRIALNMAMKEKGLKVGVQDMKVDEKVSSLFLFCFVARIIHVLGAGLRRASVDRKRSFEDVRILEETRMGPDGFEL
jgi:hypothetical protein